MRRTSIVLLGDFSAERGRLTPILRDCGCTTRHAGSLAALPHLRHGNHLAALLHAGNFAVPWDQALAAISAAAPDVPAVVCHEIGHLDAQADMLKSGAFFTLLLPIDAREFRFLFAKLSEAAARVPVYSAQPAWKTRVA